VTGRKARGETGGGESGFKRGHVGGDVDDVVVGEVADDRFHLRKVGAGSGAALHVVKLADDVTGGTSGDGRHVLEALEIGAVASGADDGSTVGPVVTRDLPRLRLPGGT